MKAYPLWEIFEKELLSKRPSIPVYDPDANNVEEWKFLSAQRKGFDLCCALFEINKE
jgi:hypothetical protein